MLNTLSKIMMVGALILAMINAENTVVAIQCAALAWLVLVSIRQ